MPSPTFREVKLPPLDPASAGWAAEVTWPSGEESVRGLRPEELEVLLHGLEATPRRNWFRR